MPTFGLAIRAILARQGARVFRAATKDVEDGAKRADRGIQRLDTRTKRLGTTFGLVARSAAGFIGSIAAIAGIRSTIRTIADFEQSTNRARVIMRLTKEQFAPIEQAFRDMAVETRFTATEVADFGAELAQASFVGKAALDVLKPSLDLAAVGALSMKQAGDVVIGTLKQFEFATDQATRVANVYTQASFLTAASVDQIAEASRKAAPLGKDLGLSFEQLTAISAVLTERIRQASRAGTGLRGTMASLLNPSKQVQEELLKLGFSANDFNIVGGKLIDVMEDMEKKAIANKTQVKLLGRENIIAGKIIGAAAPEIKKIADQLENVAITAADAASAFEDTLQGSIRRLISAVTDLQIAMGKGGLGKVLREVVDFTRDVVRALAGIDDGFVNNKESVMKFVEVLKTIGVGAAVFVGLKSAIAIISASITGLILLFAGSGIGSLLAAFGLVSAAIFSLRGSMVTFGDETSTIGEAAIATFEVLAEEIGFVIAGLKELKKEAGFGKKPQPAQTTVDQLEVFEEVVKSGFGPRRPVGFNPQGQFVIGRAPGDIPGGGGTEAALRSGEQLTILQRINRRRANLARAREFRTPEPGEAPEIPKGLTPKDVENENQALNVTKELTKQQQELIQFTQQFGDTVAESFGKMITGAETAGEALRNLADALLELVLQQTLLQPLANTISLGLASAIGGPATIGAFTPNATFRNAPTSFQHGGIVSQPTLGLFGEGGPEAILPLKRGPDGDLGLAAGGGRNVVVNMNVSTPDANSFRRSARQVFSDTRKQAARLA